MRMGRGAAARQSELSRQQRNEGVCTLQAVHLSKGGGQCSSLPCRQPTKVLWFLFIYLFILKVKT